jgi:hypothetical protein
MKVDGYKFGTKNNWRRWLWNRVSDRLTGRRKDALILYLPGMEDLDRPIAINHGFSPNNLIAVDRNKDVVENMKSKGALCINGNFLDVVKCFMKTKVKIDAVIADYCCGLTEDVQAAAAWWTPEIMRHIMNNNGVIAINLMRGRDGGEFLEQYKDSEDRHRGKMFVDSMATMSAMMYASHTFYSKNHHQDVFPMLAETYKEFFPDFFFSDEDLIDVDPWKNLVNHSFSPEHTSYKSGRIVMDSSVISIDTNLAVPVMHAEESEMPDIYREVCAILAVRTMKMTGKMRSSPAF